MIHQIAIIFALKAEASPLLTLLNLSKIEHKTLHLYKKDGILVVISGVGSENARTATREVIRELSPRVVINAGSAGSLGLLTKGDVVEIASVTSDFAGAEHLFLIDSDNAEAFPETRLVSVHSPAINDLTRTRLSLVADCVDMEGYAVADECAHHDTECRIIKIITDSFGDTDQTKIKRSIHESSASLCQLLIPVIEEYAEKE